MSRTTSSILFMYLAVAKTFVMHVPYLLIRKDTQKNLCVTKNNMDIATPTIQMLISHFHFFLVSSRLSFFTYHDGFGKIGKPAKSLP